MNLKVWAGRMVGDSIKEGPLPVFNKYLIGMRTFADYAVEAIDTLLDKKKEEDEDELKEIKKVLSKAKGKIFQGEDAETVFKEIFEEVKL